MSAALRVKKDFTTKGGDGSVDWELLKRKLSSFQIEKLTYFFHQFFDNDHNGVINADDFTGLNETLRQLAGWQKDDPKFIAMVDNHRVFLECLLDQGRAELDVEGLESRSWEEALAPSKMVIDSVSLNSWLFMWAKLCHGSAGIDDFPIWVQLIPMIIFNVITSYDNSKVITRDSLRHFYKDFTGLTGDTLEKVATEGYRSMSANGDYELDYKSYKLLFSNFLLGRTIYGPGKYVFGCFDNRDMTEKYQIIYE